MARTQELPKELKRLLAAGYFSVQVERPETRDGAKGLASVKRAEGYRAQVVTIRWRHTAHEHVVMIKPV